MQINFKTYINNQPYFKATSQKGTSPTKSTGQNMKPFIYLGTSILPIAIGFLGIKQGQKSLKTAHQKLTAVLPNINILSLKEKIIVQKMIKEGLDPKLAEIFIKVKNIEDKETFANESFNLLFEQTKYTLKPNLQVIEEVEDENILGNWCGLSFTMQLDRKNTLKQTKAKIFNTIVHELEHLKQNAIILRTEGLGVEALVDSFAYRFFKSDKKEPEICLKKFGKLPEEVTFSDIENYYEFMMDKANLKKYEIQYKKDLGVIKADSEEGLIAKRYLEANNNYTSVDYKATQEDQLSQFHEYRENILEKLAFEIGDKIQRKYEDFIIKLAEARLVKLN